MPAVPDDQELQPQQLALGIIATTLDHLEIANFDLPDGDDLLWALLELAKFLTLPERDPEVLDIGNSLISSKGFSYRDIAPKLEQFLTRVEPLVGEKEAAALLAQISPADDLF
nr:hypothetical protein [uncultured Pseudomonas sp.]